MKKLFLFISALFLSLSSFAQQYVPMPTDSAWWYGSNSDGEPGYQNYFNTIIYMNGEDTVLSGITYKKLILRARNLTIWSGEPEPSFTNIIANEPDVCIGGMREDNKVVYIRRVNQVAEQLHFDFNAQLGDTVFHNSPYTSTVTAIVPILIANNYRNKYTLTHIQYNSGRSYIEGIGELGRAVGQDVAWSFHCFHSDQSSTIGEYSTNNTMDTCVYVYQLEPTNANSSKKENQLNVYPNPFTDRISIDITIPATIGLYNSLGQCIRHTEITTGKQVLEGLTDVPSGFYFINISDENGAVIKTQKLHKK